MKCKDFQNGPRIIAIKNSQSQIFRTIYIGGQQYVWGHKLVGARKFYFKIYGAVKKRSQLESFLFSIFFFFLTHNTVIGDLIYLPGNSFFQAWDWPVMLMCKHNNFVACLNVN